MRAVVAELRSLVGWLILLSAFAHSVMAQSGLPEAWPEVSADMPEGMTVRYPSSDPFSLRQAQAGEAPQRDVVQTLFLPPGARPEAPVPAVILLHGAGGVQVEREITYARQLSSLGVAALVIDVFANRRDLGRGFLERVLNITEAMFLADAHAGLRFLDSRPEIDGSRVALVGFSYGGMAATYALYDQVAEIYDARGPRFVAHVSFYGPCIADFDRVETTGAPLLMMWGTEDAIIDPERCATTLAALRRGGSEVASIAFDGAFHQWDGRVAVPRRIGRDLSPCNFRVTADGAIRDRTLLGLEMKGPLSRQVILAACVRSDPYMIGADGQVRARSTAALAHFLNAAFGA